MKLPNEILSAERRLSRLEGKMDVVLTLSAALLTAVIAQAAGVIH